MLESDTRQSGEHEYRIDVTRVLMCIRGKRLSRAQLRPRLAVVPNLNRSEKSVPWPLQVKATEDHAVAIRSQRHRCTRALARARG